MKVNDLKSEFYALDALIEEAEQEINEETGEFVHNEDVIKEMTDELKEHEADLLDYLADKRDEYKLIEKGLMDKIKHLQDKKRTAVNQQKRLLDTIDYILGGSKFKSAEHSYYYQKSESVEIIDEADIPKEYFDFKPVIKKSDLKKALKSGEEIKGAALKEDIGVRIR